MIDVLWEGEIPKSLDNLVYVFGSYLAIIIDNNFVGKWIIEKESNEIYFESDITKVKFSPWVWIVKKFKLSE
jgi:hypothetical protein